MTTIFDLLLTLNEGSSVNPVNDRLRTPTADAVIRTMGLIDGMDKEYLYLAWNLYWSSPAGVLATLNIDGGICPGIQPVLDKLIKRPA